MYTYIKISLYISIRVNGGNDMAEPTTSAILHVEILPNRDVSSGKRNKALKIWRKTDSDSTVDPGKIYYTSVFVTYDGWSSELNWKCTCEAFTHRPGHCKHIKQTIEDLNWGEIKEEKSSDS